MLVSLAYIFILGMLAGKLCQKIKLPSLIGMLLVGIIIGPHMMNIVDESILDISGNLRQIALIIILARAGLSLNIDDLKKVGLPAFLMCFIPATCEIAGMLIFAPKFLGFTIQESLLLGSVIAAVSPAVIVPKMLYMMEHQYGTSKSIPQMILAGASVDDVFVIVIFSVALSLVQTNELNMIVLFDIPISIISGIVIGIISGYIVYYVLKHIDLSIHLQALFILCISFMLIKLEDYFTISGLLAIMSMGMTIRFIDKTYAINIAGIYSKLWIGAEILLFVLVGTLVEISYVKQAGIIVVVLLFVVLLFRILGVFLCMIPSSLNYKEKLFCAISYLPKATVQAAIGGVPLSLGLSCGNEILIIAVMAILITAPIGAILIDLFHTKLLECK